MCVCVCVKEYTQGVQQITEIKPLPIHDMSDTIIHPRKTQVQITGNGALLVPTPFLLPHLPPPPPPYPLFMTDKV